MQEKLSAAGAPPRTPLGSLKRSPDPLAGGEGDWLLPLQLPPAVGGRPFGPRFSCSPTPKLCLHLIQAGEAAESHIGYD